MRNAIRNHWTKTTLGTIADILGGGTPTRANAAYFGDFIDWVTPTDLPKIGEIRLLDRVAEGLSEEGLRHSSAIRIPRGAVLFSSRASIGKIAVTERECTTNQGFANFVPKPELVDTWFLAYLLSVHIPDITELCGETTYKEVSKGKLREFSVLIPSVDEQRRIVARLRELLDKVDEVKSLHCDEMAEVGTLLRATRRVYLRRHRESANWLDNTPSR